MYDFVIVGTGNVAFHLLSHLVSLNKKVCVIGRNKVDLLKFKKQFNVNYFLSLDSIPDYSIVFLCVPDKVIYEIIKELSPTCSIIYTAGSVGLEKSVCEKIAVFYPLQTFSKNRKVNFRKIPILIEASNKEFEQEVYNIATNFSDNVQYVDSETRQKIHLIAVICNNFTNYLINFAQDLAQFESVDFKLFEPLLIETIDKAIGIGANQAQTGPAKRNDIETINKHLELLSNDQRKLYLTITNSILENNGYKKL